MYIPESLIWAMGEDGCVAVKIYCEEGLREDIASRFSKVFNEEYEKVMDLIEEEDGDCYDREEEINPFEDAKVTDYGVYLSFYSLAMFCCGGDRIASHDAGEALENALKIIKKEYPTVRYEGYVAYCWSDTHGGEICQYSISSEKNTDGVVYDFLGEALGSALSEDETWDRLADELEEAEEIEFKKILKLFHVYSDRLPEDAMDKLIELSEENEEDITESLEEFAEALKAGEDPEISEDEYDTDSLPDGYMEAMEMFMMAEDISGKTPKRGEVLSSEGTFEIVIAKAESGDPEAKFTAGKYFIADHIEDETERAIRWIREAADEGIEEAQDYINTHSELFE